jgi:multicomponent Na+:H+ antiporter subunit D
MILYVPVLMPIAAGSLLPWLKLSLAGKRHYTAAVSGLNVLAAIGALKYMGGCEITLFWIADNLPIFFRLDAMASVYLMLIALLWVGLTLFSHDYIPHDSHENRYYAFLLCLSGALAGLGLAGNIVTFFLFFEWMTFIAFPLICHERDERSVNGAMFFLMYSVLGAALVLVGIVLLREQIDLAAFVPGGNLTGRPSSGGGRLMMAVLLTLLGFGCKAGMYPLQAWLPIAHPAAPAPISAALSALVTKAGVLGIIRVIYYIVGPAYLRETWIWNLWLATVLLTVFMGSMLAFREPQLKKRLAYSSISQIAYVLFGLAVAAPEGFTGAMLQLIFHGFAKLILFLCVGAIIHQTHRHYADEIKGIGQQMPVVMGCFTLSALSLVGIPPMGGFLGKWYLINGALTADIGIFSWLGPVILLISALLTAGYLLPLVINGFFPGSGFDGRDLVKTEPGWRMMTPLVVLTALSILVALNPSWLMRYLSVLAGELM